MAESRSSHPKNYRVQKLSEFRGDTILYYFWWWQVMDSAISEDFVNFVDSGTKSKSGGGKKDDTPCMFDAILV